MNIPKLLRLVRRARVIFTTDRMTVSSFHSSILVLGQQLSALDSLKEWLRRIAEQVLCRKRMGLGDLRNSLRKTVQCGNLGERTNYDANLEL